jgi:nicotinate-nucleotide pyrophosphorylase (carboxylating)
VGSGFYARAVDFAGLVRAWLVEDLGDGDRTTTALIPADARCSASLLLKEPGVVSGLTVCQAVFAELDPDISFEVCCDDGDWLQPGALARVEGAAAAILAGERLALNLLGRLSGIATLTRCYVEAVGGTGAVILDTRKTTPGLRALEKAAVRHGGGSNHRMGLYDGILIKENHLRLTGGIRVAVERARSTGIAVEVECETLAELAEALGAGAERILLDNMPVEQLAEAVALVRGRAKLEASGGITLDTVRAVAETGVGYISIGALTHSARSLDVSLEVPITGLRSQE